MSDYTQKKRELRLSIGNIPNKTDLSKKNQDTSKYPNNPVNKTFRNG